MYGTKGDGIYKENVYLKEMRKITGNINKDFPLVCISTAKKYLLSIYPKYHSVMFPDSILNTEDKNIITDISYTNSIHKVYVCTMDQVENLKYGDIVVLYRTAETGRSAEYSAVATSICVVEDVKKQSEFDSFDDFYRYVSKYSVFDEDDLRYWYNKGGCKAIKMTYTITDIDMEYYDEENVYLTVYLQIETSFEACNHTAGEEWSAGSATMILLVSVLADVPVIWESDDTERLVLKDEIYVNEIADIKVLRIDEGVYEYDDECDEECEFEEDEGDYESDDEYF